MSSKNGKFDSEELYKLSSVAERFGKGYAKNILVASDLDNMADKRSVTYLRERAGEMGITIIDSIRKMNVNELDKRLKNAIFW